MKATKILRPFFVSLTAVLFAASLTLTGCSLDSISGPGTEQTTLNNGTTGSSEHNEGKDTGPGKNGTTGSSEHNEGKGEQ